MKSVLHNLKALFADSPLVCLSIITCCWSYFRALLYKQNIGAKGWLRLDLPLFSASGIGTEVNMAVTLTLVALVGVIAAVVALNRDEERDWLFSLVTIILNGAAWWYAVSQLNTAPLYVS